MKKLLLLLASVICLGSWFAPSADALSFSIAVGDQPYYLHGPGYYVGHAYYVWIPGHWRHHRGHRFWVHGHYAVR